MKIRSFWRDIHRNWSWKLFIDNQLFLENFPINLHLIDRRGNDRFIQSLKENYCHWGIFFEQWLLVNANVAQRIFVHHWCQYIALSLPVSSEDLKTRKTFEKMRNRQWRKMIGLQPLSRLHLNFQCQRKKHLSNLDFFVVHEFVSIAHVVQSDLFRLIDRIWL